LAPYAYVGDDPLNGSDPIGLCVWAVTTQVGGGSYEECAALQQEIGEGRNELAKRYRDIREDKHKLPKEGPKSIAGHQQQFRNRQANLRKLLRRWNELSCTEEWGMQIPRDAWEWATKPTPVPRVNAQGNENGKVCLFGHCVEPIISGT
jgi:hypothetical protein